VLFLCLALPKLSFKGFLSSVQISGTIHKFILISCGHVKDRYTRASFPLDIQDMPYVVLYTGLEMDKKLSQHDNASYTAKTHQLACWQASISVNWAVGGVCKLFACL